MSGSVPQTRRRGGVLSVVERGWRGARECSLALEARAIPVTHLIKGWLSADVRAMIRPSPHIRIVSVPRFLFWLQLWAMLAWDTFTGRVRWLLLDHERTLGAVAWWCRAFRLTPVWITESDDGYTLQVNGKPRSLASLIGETA